MFYLLSFCPERWLRTNKEKEEIHPFASLPFGHGPRMCIGKRFADLEVQMAVAHIVKNYRIEWAGERPLGVRWRLFYGPDQPIDLRFYPV